ncbi:MAG: sulfotransferase domain-containing protein [Anaerolineae bacterium]
MSFTHTQTQQTPSAFTYVTVVSGLPRSGTSMMMQMLAAGGLSAMTDAIRQADADNPRGYFEVERVKRLKDGDGAWMSEAQGKAIKIISALLEHLPPNQRYKVIFMQRTLAETLASQRKMLIHRGEDPARIDDAELTRLFQKHLQKVEAWLAGQPNITVLYVNYNEMIAAPSPFLTQINRFLDQRLDSEQMLAAVDRTLYRNRAA